MLHGGPPSLSGSHRSHSSSLSSGTTRTLSGTTSAYMDMDPHDTDEAKIDDLAVQIASKLQKRGEDSGLARTSSSKASMARRVMEVVHVSKGPMRLEEAAQVLRKAQGREQSKSPPCQRPCAFWTPNGMTAWSALSVNLDMGKRWSAVVANYLRAGWNFVHRVGYILTLLAWSLSYITVALRAPPDPLHSSNPPIQKDTFKSLQNVGT